MHVGNGQRHVSSPSLRRRVSVRIQKPDPDFRAGYAVERLHPDTAVFALYGRRDFQALSAESIQVEMIRRNNA